MWADHWLYFSGPQGSDEKENLKKIVLILAIPFSLLYFLSPIYYFVQSFIFVIRKKELSHYHLAGILHTLSFALYIIFSVFGLSLVGKNSIVKFTYTLGFIYFPLFCCMNLLKKKPKYLLLILIYMIILFIAGIGLYLY